MDENQTLYELKLIYRHIKHTHNPKWKLKDYVTYHFQQIRMLNKGYFVLPDAKRYIERLKRNYDDIQEVQRNVK